MNFIGFLVAIVFLLEHFAFGFFLLKEKKVLLLCKICPLYCHKDNRRHDEDSSQLSYIDDWHKTDKYDYEPDTYKPWNSNPHHGHRDFPIIDEVAPKFPEYHPSSAEYHPSGHEYHPSSYDYDPSGHDYHSTHDVTWPEPGEYEIEHKLKYIIKPYKWTTTTEKPMTTTMAPTTTEEPSGICIFCKKKCNYPPS